MLWLLVLFLVLLFVLELGEVGAEACLLPGVDVVAEGVELPVEQAEGGFAEEQVQGWVVALDGGDDRFAGADGVALLLAGAGAGLATALAGSAVVVRDDGLRFEQRAAGPVGAEGSGLDDDDLDAERGELDGEGLGQAFDGVLGGVVVAGGGEADEAADGADIDDVAGSAGAHAGEDGVGGVDEAEEVGFEHGADLIVLTFFDGGEVAVAGVVDQDVDPAELGFGGFDGGGDLLGFSDVELEGERRAVVAGDEVLDLLGLTGR